MLCWNCRDGNYTLAVQATFCPKAVELGQGFNRCYIILVRRYCTVTAQDVVVVMLCYVSDACLKLSVWTYPCPWLAIALWVLDIGHPWWLHTLNWFHLLHHWCFRFHISIWCSPCHDMHHDDELWEHCWFVENSHGLCFHKLAYKESESLLWDILYRKELRVHLEQLLADLWLISFNIQTTAQDMWVIIFNIAGGVQNCQAKVKSNNVKNPNLRLICMTTP